MTDLAVHGHRGSRGTHPENALPSFAEARDAGADFVELDVHLSKDGIPVVFHDSVISGKLCRDLSGRPIQTEIPIGSLSWREIQDYEIGTTLLPQFRGQTPTPGCRIPSLEQVIQWKKAEAPKLGLNIEIKRDNPASVLHAEKIPSADQLAKNVIDLLGRYSLIDESLVQSFDFEVVRAAGKIEPRLRLSCLFEHDADFAVEARASGAQIAAPHFKLLHSANVKRCQDAGIEVLPWTVNDPDDWECLVGYGIRAIITDYPRRLREFSGKKRSSPF